MVDIDPQTLSVQLSISLDEQFEPYVLRWLAETDTKTLTWVRNAINLDLFRPEDELDNEDKHTSSIRDLVDSCKGALQFVTDLDWPDEHQNAMFFTRLAAVSTLILSKHLQNWRLISTSLTFMRTDY